MTAGPGRTPSRNASFPQQLGPPGQEAVLFGLRHGSVLRGRDKSQNVSLVLGLHTTRRGVLAHLPDIRAEAGDVCEQVGAAARDETFGRRLDRET